jgi:ketosteroid isomerase-like protein
MKNKIFKGMLGLLALTVIACSPKKTEEAPAEDIVDAVQIKTDLQTLESAFAKAMNDGKPETIVYYADDATSYSQHKPPLVGKAAIDKDLKDELAKGPKGAKVAYELQEILPSTDGQQVVEIGSYKVTDSTSTVIYSGHYMAVFHKRDGKYVCIRDMANSDMPMAEKK